MLWLDRILAGEFETEVASLSMKNGYGEEFSGNGFLRWTREAGVQIDAITDGGNAILRSLGRVPCGPGELIPNEYFLSMRGRTSAGEEITIERIVPHEPRINIGRSTVVWRIPHKSLLSNIVITETGVHPRSPRSEILLTSVLLPWPRSSDTAYLNPHFGVQSSEYDWLEFPFSGGTAVARRLSGELSVARLNNSIEDHPRAALALRHALGFAGGAAIGIEAEEVCGERSITRTLFARKWKAAAKRLPSPLPDDPLLRPVCEPFLTRAMEFFQTDTGRRAGNLLHMCHMSLGSTFTAHALSVCVALEGLIELVSRPRKRSISEDQRDKILHYAETVGLDDGPIRRLRGFIETMDTVGPKNCLHDWAEKKLLRIDTADVRAWGHLRNRIAHGDLLMDGDNRAQMQAHLSALGRVTNVLNKVLLNAMQHDGNYHDHAECRIAHFSSAPLQ
jgi:hypothetical protein